jgi:uncharacterized protein (DUF362 family)
MRLRNHPDFRRKVLAINKLLGPVWTLVDGTYFLDQSGPMVGVPVRKDLLVASNDAGAAALACCEIMRISPRTIRHLRFAAREKMMPAKLEDIELNKPLDPFKTHQFHLKRSLINYIALAAFHSHFGTRLLYDSALAGPLHRVLYAIRRNPVLGRLLYGSTGPPQE